MGQAIYVVSDIKNDFLPLCVGTITEVSAFSGKSKNTILSTIAHDKERGKMGRFFRLEDDDD